MSSNSSIRNAGWLLVLSGLCASTAWAHHGGGTFDANKCFVFKGKVRQVAWANPHAWIYVNVDKPGGGTELWGFEFGSVGGLARAGFRPSDFPQGTPLTITAYANRDIEKHTGSANRLILPDGRDVAGSEIAGTAPAGGPPGGAPRGGGAGGPPGAGAPPGAAPGAGGPPAGGPPGGGRRGGAANCPDYK